jgi:hypothetical protein
MTKISQYSTDVNITGNDKWIGSDAQNFLITKNFTPNNLANYFNENNVIDIGTSIRYRYQTLLPGEAREQGTISFETEIGPQVNFSAITTFLIAKNTLKGNTVTQYLDFLVDGKVLLSRASNINIFGYYKITSIEPWIPNTNFFVVEVDFLSGNGFISEDLDYLVSLVDKVQDIPPPVWGSITGDIEDQTDLINYISSQVTIPTLQEVLEEGNITTEAAIFGNPLNDYISIGSLGIAIIDSVNERYISIGPGQVQVSDNNLNYIEMSFPGGFSTGNYIGDNGYFNGSILEISGVDGIIRSGLVKSHLAFIDESNPLSSIITYFYIDKLSTINGDYAYPTGTSSPLATLDDIPSGGVTSVGLTMPSAFTVTNSPITSSGDIAVTGAGLVSQYVRGDGTLANFPNSTGGGSSVNYYLNGSVSQGTFGGDTYYQMSKTPILGAGTNFTRANEAGNGYIASFITDAGDPSFLNIPGGNWNLEFYFNASSGGGSPSFYAELYKVSATNVFTLIASDSLNPEGITNGTTVDQYFTSIPVPQTTLLVTDRLAVRIYVITSGRTITLHTENGNLCEVLTTFTTGLTALNGLTDQVQFFDVGTGATNFNISSSGDTHTFNLLFNIRRNANNSSNNNINYNGYAVTGSAESSAVWTITRLTISASGSITVATATNVAWTDRETTIYT